MKTLRILALIVASAMFLAACTNGGGGTPGPTTGTLTVNVGPVAGAITVKDATNAVVDTQTAASYSWTNVAPGNYTIEVAAPIGYLDGGGVATVVAGGTAVVNLTLAASSTVPGNVANVEILGFVDDAGDAYDWQYEVNPIVDKILVAAQTEEMVGVIVKVTDAEGDPIANAPVTVSITNDFTSALAIYPGCPVEVSPAAAQTFQGVTTDPDGMACFTIEATNNSVSWQELLNALLREFAGDADLSIIEPVKLIVSAYGGNNVAKRTEFKTFFSNMSHLWYGDDEDRLIYTDARLGADLGTFVNVWDNRPGADNSHYFGTFALTKQPSYGPFPVPYFGLSTEFGGYFPGSVDYTIVEGDDVEFGNCGLQAVETAVSVEPYSGPYSVLSSDGLTCTVIFDELYLDGTDLDVASEMMGYYLALTPKTGVSLEDLPIEATIHVTYYFGVQFGQDYYEFALKDYTFTKRWVGGYLVVDKFVDQHVLTWAGEPVTLAASSVTYDEVYTSKVHVVVSNPSQSTMYNVSVRDVVPAELGVVTGSISDGGTYDAFNHAVTWNNVPELDALAPGADPIVLTFDVYARHKPGYCWTPGATFGDIAPLLPEPGTNEPCDPYDDPYDVTNGEQYQDFSGNTLLGVTAAAQFVDDETEPQVVFYYEPQDDESTIWVVRPLFAINKTLVSPDVMDVGATAVFDITVRQIDRVSTVVDTGNTEYAFLNERYPWEFEGSLLVGAPFHAVDRDEDDSFEVPSGVIIAVDGSDVRDNPYARNVVVTDAFDYALDFTSGIDFNDALIVPGSTKVVGKTVTFDAIPNLSRGESQSATLRLTGQLPSDDLENAPFGNFQNGAIAQLGDDGLYAWQNCAYLFAPQLNQPHPDSPTFADTIYDLWPDGYPTVYGLSNLWIPWFQIDGVYQFGTELVPNATDAPFVPNNTTPWPITAAGRIESCAIVAVVPQPPLPFLGINVDGEHEIVEFNVDTTLTLDGRRDVFSVGETFFYVYSVENSGGGAALNVLVEIERTNNRTAFTAAPTLYTTTAPRTLASLFTQEANGGYYNLTLNTAGEKHLVIPVMQPNEVVVIVIPASANLVGGQTITHQVPSYDNPPVHQDFAFLISTDSTSVAP